MYSLCRIVVGASQYAQSAVKLMQNKIPRMQKKARPIRSSSYLIIIIAS